MQYSKAETVPIIAISVNSILNYTSKNSSAAVSKGKRELPLNKP